MFAKCVKRAFASLCIGLLSLLLLAGCSSYKDYTETVSEFYDYAGNQLQGVEVTYSDNAFGCSARFKYKGLPIGGMSLNQRYEAWTKAGQPEEAVKHVYHYIYSSDGTEHVLFYNDGKDACFEISLPDPNGEHSGVSVYLGEDGTYYIKNPVTGNGNRDSNDTKLHTYEAYYYDKAEEIMRSLDLDYLANLDPSTSVSREELTDTSTETEDTTQSNRGSSTAVPDEAIEWSKAYQHVGEVVTLYGKVVDAEYATTSNGRPTFLDIGASYPNSDRLSVVIWGEDRASFSSSPEKMYRDKTIAVTGEVYIYEGVCNIEVSSPRQIQVLD